MAATYKPRSGLELPDATPQSPNHLDHCISAYQCMKTNGSLVRSFTTEKGQIPTVNGGTKLEDDQEDDMDHPFPQLEDVEALLREYSRSSTQKKKQLDDTDKSRKEYNKDDDDDDENEDDASSPILLSECPEFQAYLQPPQPFVRECDEGFSNEDEIIFGFMSRKTVESLPQNKEVTGEEINMWDLVETQESSTRKDNAYAPSPFKRSYSQDASKDSKALTASGVAALMNCAETEMSRLRLGIGAAGLRMPLCQNVSKSSSAIPSTPPSPPAFQMKAEEDEELTVNTDGTLKSRMQMQLAQINRVSEAVRIEFSNQLAHERALLELLELEHDRVTSEVKTAEKKYKFAPPDLVNQLRHLKDRLQQQKALIDDLEYQYLEDKTKYEEEKQSLVTLLKLQADAPPKASLGAVGLEKRETSVEEEKGLEDVYTYPMTVFASNGLSRTNSPMHFPDASDSIKLHCSNHFRADGNASSSAMKDVPSPLEEGSSNVTGSAIRNTDNTNSEDFEHRPPSISSASPVYHPMSNKPPSIFNQQNGLSFDETYFSGREDLIESPHTSSSLPGLNAHVAKTSPNSSILLPSSNDPHQSCTSSSNHIFNAVPPLLSSSNLSAEQQQWIGKDTTSIQCADEVHVRQRQRTSSATTHHAWQHREVRPLTRYLPVPDDISFDLRHHLEVICGHILCSPFLMPHLHVDASTCAGYLYKMGSRVTAASVTNDSDSPKRWHCEGPFSDVSTVSSSSTFFSPATNRIRRRTPNVTSPNGGGSFMTALFHRSRRGKRRWFVLDRRRRLLIYYSCHTSKSSNATSVMKPKDVISFTDIIDVYPDQQVRKNNTSFCLLLVASCPPPPYQVSQHQHQRPPPTPTRILSLAAPSPEATRVWVDALFTCAGAYLCLPQSQHQSRIEP